MITFIVLLFLAVVLSVCLSIHERKEKRREEQEAFEVQQEEFRKFNYGNGSKTSARPPARQIVTPSGLKPASTYSSPYPQKMLFGVPVTSGKQQIDWYVYKNFIEAIHETVNEMITNLKDKTYPVTPEYVESLKQYVSRHNEIRSACNIYSSSLSIRDKDIDGLYERWQSMSEGYRKHRENLEETLSESIKYLSTYPDKTCPRTTFITAMSAGLGVAQEQMKLYYKELINAQCLIEYQIPPSNRYIVKFFRKKLPDQKTAAPSMPGKLPPSVYSPVLYEKVDYMTVAKARITVSAPEELDREKNTCLFRSQSRNDIYRTSLSKCTCQAYKKGHRPCKHMVALAIAIGYFDPSSVPAD